MPRLTAPRRQAEVCAPLPAAHAAARYARHRPERTLLYSLVQAHWPDFLARREVEDRPLPEYVREEFETYLRCGVLEHGFLRVVCEHCRAERLVAYSCKKRGLCPSCGARRMAESARHLVDEVFGPRPVRQWVLSFPYPLRFLFASKPEAIGPVLGIVHRVIAGWLADQAGVPRDTSQCGAVTLIQRFGSALNLNVHFHMLWLDGVYDANVEPPRRKPRLRRARAPTSAQLTQLANTIAHRVCRHLSRRGWLEGEDESVFLSDSAGSDDGMDGLRMSSITYRIATGRDAGRKVVTLKTLPGDAGSLDGDAGKVGGFSLHAGVAAEAHESHKLEKLCRYIVTIQNDARGVARITGAVLGGIAGSAIGGGNRANAAGAVAGAAAGGALGNAAGSSSRTGIEITVDLDSGLTVAIAQDGDMNQFRVGDRVRVASDGVTTRVSR